MLTGFLRFTLHAALDIRRRSSRLLLSCSPSFLCRFTYILPRISRPFCSLVRRVLGRATQIFRAISRVVSGITYSIGATLFFRLECTTDLLRCVAEAVPYAADGVSYPAGKSADLRSLIVSMRVVRKGKLHVSGGLPFLSRTFKLCEYPHSVLYEDQIRDKQSKYPPCSLRYPKFPSLPRQPFLPLR